MAHVITKAEFINQYLNGFPISSLEDLNLWVTRAAVDEALAKIADSFPAPGTTQLTYQNRKLGDYSGFSHSQLQSVFGLTSEQATDVMNALGVVP